MIDKTLAREVASKITLEWIKDRIPSFAKHQHSQREWLLQKLAEKCIAETIRVSGSEYHLYDRLEAAKGILSSLWYITAPTYAKYPKVEDMDKKLQEEMLSLIHISEPTRLGMISYAVFCLKKK